MKKNLTIPLLLMVCTLPAAAQNWSVGARTGAFIFGDFIERRVQTVGGGPAGISTLTLSAAIRPGLSVDLERRLGDRWGVRVEGTFTRSPLTVKDTSEDGTDLRSGEVDVTTFSLPIVFRINTGGAFRFHLLGGPAHVIYRFEAPDRAERIAFADVTRSEWGYIYGGGVAWQLSERFGIEGAISDTVTDSPFDESDVPPVPGFTFPEAHNVHTTVGVRYRF